MDSRKEGKEDVVNVRIPGQYRGRMTPERRAKKIEEYAQFAEDLQRLARSVDFKMSARGYCYILESYGLTKDEFDRAERLINRLRKGDDDMPPMLPVDFTADDASRVPNGQDGTECDYPVARELEWLWDSEIRGCLASYAPVRWVDYQPCYAEVLVEKIDLVGLNESICREFRTVVSNSRGDSDINSRAKMLRRFQDRAADGQALVLLLEGDHDPKGLHITENMRTVLHDLVGSTFTDGYRLEIDVDEIEIVRFGLNYDFIEANGLTWIDNLITGAGKNLADPAHHDHTKSYVQDYLQQYGARKCEANALVTAIDAGRQLMRDTLSRYVDLDGVRRYEADVESARAEIRAALPAFLREKTEGM